MPGRLTYFRFVCYAIIGDLLLRASETDCDESASDEMNRRHLMLPTDIARNTTHLLDQLLRQYDRRLRPGFLDEPLAVDVNLNVRSIGPVSELEMTDLYFRQSWVDQRLAFSGSPLTSVQLSVKSLDRFWTPDTFFQNGRHANLHTVTVPNKFLRLNRNGRLLYSMRLTIAACCPMHLENFPLDTQSCPLQFGSHGYSEDDVIYRWADTNSIQLASDMTLSQFDLVAATKGNGTRLRLGGRRYSMLQANFILRRHMGYFLINVYVPCSILVIISWVGFWINREATADRIALGVTTVLTMAFLAIDNRGDLPKVSYSTALDYFVGVCFGFVLATILQFAGVHFFTKRNSGEAFDADDTDNDDDDHDDDRGKDKSTLRKRRRRRRSQRVEEVQDEKEEEEEEEEEEGDEEQKQLFKEIGIDDDDDDDDTFNRNSIAKNHLPWPRSKRSEVIGGRVNVTTFRQPGSVAKELSITFPSTRRLRSPRHRNHVAKDGAAKRALVPQPRPQRTHLSDVAMHSSTSASGRRAAHCVGRAAANLLNCLVGDGAYAGQSSVSPGVELINSVSRIDRLSRILFPSAFATFHVFYWIHYISKDDDGEL